MNINFADIFHLSINQAKANWKKILLNSVIYNSIITAISILIIIIFIVVALLGIGFIAEGSFAIGMSILVILGLIGLCLIFLITFLYAISSYVIAMSAMDENRIISSLKSVFTKRNCLYYITYVFFPILLSTIASGIIWALAVVWLGALGIIVIILSLIIYALICYNAFSLFTISLYHGTDIKKSRELLLQTSTRKDIFRIYLIQIGNFFLVSLVASVIVIIPILGILLEMLFLAGGYAAITQAMIIRIRNEQPSVPSNIQNQNICITSDKVKVMINTRGAEIKSVVCNDKEYMWQADPEYWGRTAPVLFPFVGKLKDDKYIVNDRTIDMQQHGFLRDREFYVTAQTANSVTFEYKSTGVDYAVYPFEFTVQIGYLVVDRKVTTTYNVINNGNYPLSYQIGAHPAFNVESVDDLKLVFPEQLVTKHYFADGLQTEVEQATINEQQLSYELINTNIPCYSDFSKRELVLKNKGEDYIKFNFNSMEYLAVWSPEFKNAKFICIEPWNGICSRADQPDYLLENKAGMNVLNANASESCTFSFELC